MKLRVLGLISVFLVSSVLSVTPSSTLAQQPDDPPEIVEATVQGKKLLVRGENFAMGAVIFVDGKKQKTKNSEDDPSRILIAKKGGKKIGRHDIVTLTVQNTAEQLSEPFPFFNGRRLTIADNKQTLTFAVGDQFLIVLGTSHDWILESPDFRVLTAVPTLVRILGAQGLFEATARGQTGFKGTGKPRCASEDPPCKSQSVEFEVKIVVE
jgi:hypothetical protein